MTDEKPRVIIIPPKPELQQTVAVTKQLRVAAYCRVSTKEEEQASSYEAQCEYYTDKIMSNKEWTMAGIFADESAIIGLSQNPVQTGGDLALFFLFSAQFSANEGVPA